MRIRLKVTGKKRRKQKRGERRPDLVDRVETVVRRTPSSVVDRMERMVREHTVDMVDREATVVHVERMGLLEVEDEVE